MRLVSLLRLQPRPLLGLLRRHLCLRLLRRRLLARVRNEKRAALGRAPQRLRELETEADEAEAALRRRSAAAAESDKAAERLQAELQAQLRIDVVDLGLRRGGVHGRRLRDAVRSAHVAH